MAVPTVTSVTPNTDSYLGGIAVLIIGSGFTGTTGVTIGGEAADFELSSDTLLAAVTPAHGAGAAQVIVTNATGASTDVVTITYSGSPVLFSVAAARLFDKAQLTSSTVYSDATIIAAEITIRTKFERIIGTPLTPTTFTEYYDGDGTNTLYLNHHNPWSAPTPSAATLTSVTVIATDDTETAFTATELSNTVKYSHKLVRRSGSFTAGYRNIKVVYSVGHTTCPTDIKNAALQALLLPPPDGIVPGNIPSPVIDGTDGTVNWSRVKDPNKGKWYGNEAIDAVLREHRALEMIPAIA